jgi:hypothetical protein
VAEVRQSCPGPSTASAQPLCCTVLFLSGEACVKLQSGESQNAVGVVRNTNLLQHGSQPGNEPTFNLSWPCALRSAIRERSSCRLLGAGCSVDAIYTEPSNQFIARWFRLNCWVCRFCKNAHLAWARRTCSTALQGTSMMTIFCSGEVT